MGGAGPGPGVIGGHPPCWPIETGDHVDAGIGEVRLVDSATELERAVFVGDDEGGMIHVDHGEDRRLLLPPLLGDEEVSPGIPDELQVVTTAHPRLDPCCDLALETGSGWRVGQLSQPLLSGCPGRHQQPLLGGETGEFRRFLHPERYRGI